ncbi:tyrosine-protein phosphatase [Amycolatopsis sp. NBC_00348]|uniref:tyrosine-protein phosphatase n=1 Tax=Amycolatopsis sp. NBC_00348 TaxID=2975956 RepID=UPI002E25D2D7
MSRAVAWDGFFNTRDLGGLPTKSGETTGYGAFFRSADLRFVIDAGWAQAREAGVRTVVDLRNATRSGLGPNREQRRRVRRSSPHPLRPQ